MSNSRFLYTRLMIYASPLPISTISVEVRELLPGADLAELFLSLFPLGVSNNYLFHEAT
jgi:hypothetical protein